LIGARAHKLRTNTTKHACATHPHVFLQSGRNHEASRLELFRAGVVFGLTRSPNSPWSTRVLPHKTHRKYKQAGNITPPIFCWSTQWKNIDNITP